MSETKKRRWLVFAVWTIAWLILTGVLLGLFVYQSRQRVAQEIQRSKEAAGEFGAAWLKRNQNNAARP